MASDKSQLLEMGFEEARVGWALKATKNSGLQPALDHIIANMDSPVPSADAQGSAGAGDEEDEDDDSEALKAHISKMKSEGNASAGNGEVLARSVKCSECGKVFKNADLVSFHAEKSGHSNFEESTEEYVPLTAEQTKEKLEDLRIKLAEKRAKQALVNVEENKANEKLRRKAGQDSGEMKQALAIKEMEKEAAAKKRGTDDAQPSSPSPSASSPSHSYNDELIIHQPRIARSSPLDCLPLLRLATPAPARSEKLEDARAKAAIRAQIAADKEKRAEKAAREKAIREGLPVPGHSDAAPAAAPPAPRAVAPAATGVKGSEYKETRLQVRLSTGGAPLVKAFNSDAPLSEVAEWIASENLSYDVSSVKLSTTFPRKVFGPGDMLRSLRDNGLTPSAVLMASP